MCHVSRDIEGESGLSTHRAENSSNDSSWCSERMRVVVLKLVEARVVGTTKPARAASGPRAAATALARKKVVGEPRTATRTIEADIW